VKRRGGRGGPLVAREERRPDRESPGGVYNEVEKG
jgi:hypothetical protein